MKTYDDKEIKDIDWTKYKIIVPREEDKVEIMDVFKHFHDNGFDSNLVAANQLAHEYLYGTNIIVDPELYDKFIK